MSTTITANYSIRNHLKLTVVERSCFHFPTCKFNSNNTIGNMDSDEGSLPSPIGPPPRLPADVPPPLPAVRDFFYVNS